MLFVLKEFIMKNREKVKQQLRKRHKRRIRKKISGTPERPRLVVSRGNRNITAQLVDDVSNRTLCMVSSVAGSYKAVKESTQGKLEVSKQVGLDVAKLALKRNIKKVVFDRSNCKYQGRVKMVAEGAREGGLEF